MTIPSKFGNLLMHKREFYRLLATPQHKASFLRSVLHNSCMMQSYRTPFWHGKTA